MINQPMNTSNERNGNGKYTPLKREVKKSQKKGNEFSYLSTTDRRMRFNTSKDPIYFAFEQLEKRSVVQLANDFVKDSVVEIKRLVTNVVR